MRRESIREWWKRSTERTRRVLAIWGVLVLPVAIVLFVVAPREFILDLQIFNGAYTIPVVAALWMFAFVYLFLRPTREAAFRSTESMERLESRFEELEGDVRREISQRYEEDVIPVIQRWEALGQRLDERIDEDTLERVLAALGAAPVPRAPALRTRTAETNGSGGGR